MQRENPLGERVHQPGPRLGDQRDLVRLLDVPLPAVDGAEAGDYISTGGQALADECAGDALGLGGVGAGDVDEAEVGY